jgi:hypothetical protein
VFEEMALAIWKWRLSYGCFIAGAQLGNDFQQPLENEEFRYFHMSSTSTPTGDQPTQNVVGQPGP